MTIKAVSVGGDNASQRGECDACREYTLVASAPRPASGPRGTFITENISGIQRLNILNSYAPQTLTRQQAAFGLTSDCNLR